MLKHLYIVVEANIANERSGICEGRETDFRPAGLTDDEYLPFLRQEAMKRRHYQFCGFIRKDIAYFFFVFKQNIFSNINFKAFHKACQECV